MKGINGNKLCMVDKSYYTTEDGGIVIRTGGFSTVANYDISCMTTGIVSEVVFQKYDSTGGNLMWEKCFPIATGSPLIQYLFPTGSAFFEAGREGQNANGVTNVLIRKADQQDNVIWSKEFFVGGAIDAISQTTDGGFIIVSSPSDTGGEVYTHYGPPMSFDIFVIKVDSNGNKLWSKVIGGSADDEALKVIATADGGGIIVGSTFSNDFDFSGSHSIPWMYNDGFVVRLDGVGNIKWNKCLGGSMKEFFSSACCDNNGGVYVLGSTSSSDYDVTGYIGNVDYWLVHLDSNGNKLWDKCYGTQQHSEFGQTATGYEDICRVASGDLYMLLYANKDFASYTDTSYGGGDALVLRTDSAGTITGYRTLGSPKFDGISMIAALKAGVIVAGGFYTGTGNTGTMPDTCWPDPTSSNNTNGFLVRLAPWTTAVHEVAQQGEDLLSISPNPAGAYIIAEVKNRKKGILRIVNAAGEVVYVHNCNAGNTVLDINTGNWPKGLYIAEWTTAQGGIKTQKVILQ
jgi:hypothetical protein